MKESLISFKTAKLAKEKGFFTGTIFDIYPLVDFFKSHKIGVLSSILMEESLDIDLAIEEGYYAEAPTQSLLQKWLREEYKSEVYVVPHFICYDPSVNNNKGYYEVVIDNTATTISGFETYEAALEAGLIHALKLLPCQSK